MDKSIKLISKKYLPHIFLSIFLMLFTIQFSITDSKTIEFGIQEAEARNLCACPNGEKKGSGNYDWGAVWQFCDNCEQVTNREASNEECDCDPGST